MTALVLQGEYMCKCGTRASFACEDSVYPLFCLGCADEKMVFIIPPAITQIEEENKKYPDCQKCHLKWAVYGDVNGRPQHCRDCKKPDQINRKSNKCHKCHKADACYALPGGKVSCCRKCKDDNMILLHSSAVCYCGARRPTYNFHGFRPFYCKLCRNPTMVDTKSRKCYCGRSCLYGWPYHETSTVCLEHKLDGMVYLRYRHCHK